MSGTARYVYAVARAPLTLTGVEGLGGPVEVLEHRGLAALVSTVGTDEFGEEALQRNLEQLAWLERTARGHDDVVRSAARLGPTAPLRLLTICHDDAAVRARLDEWYEPLTEALDRVAGRAEWSVKVFASSVEPPPAGAQPTPSGGAAYLRAKQAAAQARRTRDDAALQAAEEVLTRAQGIAVATRQLAPQDPRLTGRTDRMVLNLACLLDDDASDKLAETLEDVRRPGILVEVGGPWPPYSFATLEHR